MHQGSVTRGVNGLLGLIDWMRPPLRRPLHHHANGGLGELVPQHHVLLGLDESAEDCKQGCGSIFLSIARQTSVTV